MNIYALLGAMTEKNASDLHIRAGAPPVFRINGALFRARMEPLTPDHLNQFVQELLSEDQKKFFENNHEMDFALGVRGVGRFRFNVFHQRGTPSFAIRSIKTNVPKFDDLNMPSVILDLCLRRRGLILVTGTTGSGKTTLLSSMIDHINRSQSVNIVTIEDPIEYLHRDKKSVIAQREIGTDAGDFATALRGCFRQDPDVILIGEIRDKDTMETALSASDTGHLVMSTLHTINAVETISRIITFFPPHQHEQVRLILSSVLVAVVSLRLVPRTDGQGRVPAAEIMINTASVSEYIREPDKAHLILEAISDGKSQYGSQTFDQSLYDLYQSGMIAFEVAKQNANNPENFELRVKGISGASDRWQGMIDE
ncbi:MAG: type IV pilus twitching motility protein PilT [Fibrobacterota bacterium]